MLIIGAKGSAKDVLVVLEESDPQHIAFYDDTGNSESHVFEKHPILKNEEEVSQWFADYGSAFAVAIGHTRSREKLVRKFQAWGGEWTSCISTFATIGNHSKIGKGAIILPGARISNGISIGEGSFFGVNSVVGHDCEIGDFVTVSPGATLLGYVEVGNFSYLGANSTILPKVSLGKHVFVGAGTVLNRKAKDYESIVAQRNYED